MIEHPPDDGTAYPRTMIIESSSRCNFLCPLCLWTHNRHHGYLSAETYARFIEQAAPFLQRVCFAGRGEPTLNPRLAEILAISARSGVVTDLATNGSSLIRDGDALLDTGIDAVNVSIEADTADDFVRYRIRGDFDSVVEGMRRIALRKRQRGLDRPRLRTCSTIFGYNEDRLDRLREFFASLGFEEFIFKSAHLGHGQLEESEDSLRERWLPSNPRLRRSQFNEAAGPTAIHCSFLTQAHLLWNGDIGRCAIDHESMVVGNILEASFDEIWRGPRSLEVARTVVEGRFPKCASCTFSGRSRSESGRELYVL
ncbi:molybdenum cofactor biosynthesis protein A [Aquisphaera giovannonii]|uniref:Molybdenum cofactor biosynthesis protein A n=1 Tax=Aquisphaera giovannonii TaxID=406548 RepID=A0A5B9VVY7_9BACT|nr:radical SAM protein [Aquisphaera giovannonii]QEH32402.1 molybdenum cofactor biosynthesis protein A [Aquisphaera giovannonii]